MNKFTYQPKRVVIIVLKRFKKLINTLRIKFWAITDSLSKRNLRPKNWLHVNSCFTGQMLLYSSFNTEKEKRFVNLYKTKLFNKLLTSSKKQLWKSHQHNTELIIWKTQHLHIKKAAELAHGFIKAALSSVTSKLSPAIQWDLKCSLSTFIGPGVRTSMVKELGLISVGSTTNLEGWISSLITLSWPTVTKVI